MQAAKPTPLLRRSRHKCVRTSRRLYLATQPCQGRKVIGPAEKVIRLLGVTPDDRLLQQIEKFIRCNGQLGVVKAANAVAQRRKSDPDVLRDPWAYCIRVFNASAARSVVLHQMLYLLENSLRSRVDGLMATTTGPGWYQDVHSYLPRDIAPVFLSDDQFQAIQERSTATEPPYPIKKFKQGLTFTEQIPLWGLNAIITHNYAAGHLYELFVPPAGEQRLDPEFVQSALDKIRSARNSVAHNRPVTPALYEQTRIRVHRFLVHLEFDVERALLRVGASVEDLFSQLRT